MFEFSKIVLNLQSQNSQEVFLTGKGYLITIKKINDEKRNSS
jgi:competence protein ComGF